MTNEEEDLFTSMAKICHIKERIVQIEPTFNGTEIRFRGSTAQLLGDVYSAYKIWSSPAQESGINEGRVRERRLCRSVLGPV
jgi:hypothetical protein